MVKFPKSTSIKNKTFSSITHHRVILMYNLLCDSNLPRHVKFGKWIINSGVVQM